MNNSAFFASVILIISPLFLSSGQSQPYIGTWSMAEAVDNGIKVPSSKLKMMRLAMNRAGFRAYEDKEKSSGNLTVDESTSPVRMTFEITRGSDKGREVKAIFKKLDDQIQIAFSRAAEFPADFSSRPGDGILLVTYKVPEPEQDNSGKAGITKFKDVQSGAAGIGGRGKDD